MIIEEFREFLDSIDGGKKKADGGILVYQKEISTIKRRNKVKSAMFSDHGTFIVAIS